LFHEGHLPTAAEVVGSLVDAPSDGSSYGRESGNWVKVATAVVSDSPPPVSTGEGLWFNLADGQLYIDINDGDSTQWVIANPPLVLEPPEAAAITQASILAYID
jgi:hypothetical protein